MLIYGLTLIFYIMLVTIRSSCKVATFIIFSLRKCMNNNFRIVAISGLLAISSMASAQWNFGAGYANYSESDEGVEISVGALYASVGYEYVSDKITFMPELRIGTGVTDDTVFDVNIEIDSFIAASIRGQYNVNESFGVFLQPSYGRLAVTASANGQSFSDDNWEFGFGGGASIKVSDTTSIEAFYESYDASDVLSVAVRFTF